MVAAKFLAVVLIGYLLGSIPSGLFVSRCSGKGDIRAWGSGRTGTTNVLRTVGKKAALLVLLLDILKGAASVVIAGLIMKQEYMIIGDSGAWWLLRSAQVSAGLAAIAGHNWPIFFGFRGGRGVATFMGGLFALCPVAAVFSGEIFIIGAGLTRYASLASLAGVVGAFVILLLLTIINGFPVEYLMYALVGALVIIFMHRSNIKRLLAGTERRLGEKAEGYASTSPTEGTG